MVVGSSCMPALSSFVAFERISVAAMLLTVDGTVVEINPAACRMFGLAADAVVGRSLGDLVRCDGDLHQLLEVAAPG